MQYERSQPTAYRRIGTTSCMGGDVKMAILAELVGVILSVALGEFQQWV